MRNFATYKSSTGLVGLAVDPNGGETLNKLAEQILTTVKVLMRFYCNNNELRISSREMI